MNEILANVAAMAATVSTIVFLVPQISKLIRTGDSAGVSTTWAALGLVTNVGWFAYLINQGFWVAILAPFAGSQKLCSGVITDGFTPTSTFSYSPRWVLSALY